MTQTLHGLAYGVRLQSNCMKLNKDNCHLTIAWYKHYVGRSWEKGLGVNCEEI